MTEQEKGLKVFTYFPNEAGDYTVCYDFNGDNQTPVLSQRSERAAQIVCESLNKILADVSSEKFSDTEADGIVFCGKCGKQK